MTDSRSLEDKNHQSYTSIMTSLSALVATCAASIPNVGSVLSVTLPVVTPMLLTGSGLGNESLRGFAAQGNVEGIRQALAAGVSVDTRGNSDCLWALFSARNDCTPLMLAASYGHFSAVKVLVEQGRANLNIISSLGGNTALDLAVKDSHRDIAIYLFGKGAALKSVGSDQLSRLIGVQSAPTMGLR